MYNDVPPGKNADVAWSRDNMRRPFTHGLLSCLFYDIGIGKAESDATVIVSTYYKPRTFPDQPIQIRS